MAPLRRNRRAADRLAFHWIGARLGFPQPLARLVQVHDEIDIDVLPLLQAHAGVRASVGLLERGAQKVLYLFSFPC